MLYDFADDRQCGECFCSGPEQHGCTTSERVFDNNECGGAGVEGTTPCILGANVAKGTSFNATVAVSGGGCTPQGDTEPTGTVQRTDEWTVCCLP